MYIVESNFAAAVNYDFRMILDVVIENSIFR